MTQEINVLKVPFFGTELLLVEHNEQPYVAMKQIVDELQLDWKTQYDKLNQRFSKGMVISPIPSNGGVQETVCMSLRKFPAWLYTLNPNKMPEHKRDKVVTYQEECDEVLWQYWTTGIASRETVKKKLAEIEAFEEQSKQNGSEGSKLMHRRKKEIKEIEVLKANARQLDLFRHFELSTLN